MEGEECDAERVRGALDGKDKISWHGGYGHVLSFKYAMKNAGGEKMMVERVGVMTREYDDPL